MSDKEWRERERERIDSTSSQLRQVKSYRVDSSGVGGIRMFFGTSLLLVGMCTMFGGLVYKADSNNPATILVLEIDRFILNRAAFSNTGGILAVCGSVLLCSGRSCRVRVDLHQSNDREDMNEEYL
jgi:hypothetical protein